MLKELLYESCKKIDIELSDEQLSKFILYKDELLEWNKKVNLTGITDEKEVILKHFVDCLILLNYADFKGKKVIDVGTGAGFPGIPLKILHEDMEITLLDSLNKRITFLDHVTKKLGLKNVSSVHARAEDGGRDKNLRDSFDICASRAVANLSVLSEYCLPYVKPGGIFLSMKGPDVEEELKNAKKAITLLSGEIIDVKTMIIPDTDIKHSIIVIKKIKPTHPIYPRTSAKIKKEPLGSNM